MVEVVLISPMALQSFIPIIPFVDSSREEIVFKTQPPINHVRIAADTVADTSPPSRHR